MGRTCNICGKDAGLKIILLKGGGAVCPDCAEMSGRDIHHGSWHLRTTIEEIRRDLVLLDMDAAENGNAGPSELLQQSGNTQPSIEITRHIGKYLNIDDKNRKWCVTSGMFNKTNGRIHYFDDVINVELLEDGETIIKGGAGGAIAGGLLFGGVGAIVGASTGKKKATGKCSSLRVKITVRSRVSPVEYIDLIKGNGSVSKKSSIYKNAIQTAQEILSIFQVMIHQSQVNKQESKQNPQVVLQQVNIPDEIRKYKELMDDGIITQEEFDAKKKQLLGL